MSCEQQQEVELLRSVFISEFIELGEQIGTNYAIVIKPDENAFDGMTVHNERYTRKFWVFYLIVDCPEDYPNTSLPKLVLTKTCPVSPENLNADLFADRSDEMENIEFEPDHMMNPDANVISKLVDFLGTAPRNLQDQGCTVIIFDLINAFKDLLVTIVQEKYEVLRKIENQMLEAAVQSEMKKFQGTKVTRENFLAWRRRFDAEMEALEAHERAAAIKSGALKICKQTGRQMFENDGTMAGSDNKFITDDDEVIDVSAFDEGDRDEIEDIHGSLDKEVESVAAMLQKAAVQ